VQLRLFAPFLPFTTEDVWSWWQEGSVHLQSWPDAGAVTALAGDGDAALVDDVAAVLTGVRKAKSEMKASMRADVSTATVTAPTVQAARLRTAAGDICAVGRIASLTITEAEGPIEVVAELAEA
jgi:valyl-tRNA synthetase